MSNGINPDDSTKAVEVAKEFLELQKKDLEVRQLEIEARSKDLDNQKDIALAAIKAQKEDRQESRRTYQSISTRNKIFAFAVVVVLSALSIALVWLEQAPLAEKIVTYVLAAALGAFGGYGYAMRTAGPVQSIQE